MPGPGNHIYTGSKIFIDNFTKSLAATPQYKNIDFLILNTGSVTSCMNRGTLMLTCLPDDYVKQALSHLGNDIQDPGHFKHHIFISLYLNPILSKIVINDMRRKAATLGYLEIQKPVKK